MKVVVLTADSAQRDGEGKVHALGMTWTWTGTPTPPMALVIFIDPDPGQRLPSELELAVELVDSEGEPVHIGGVGESPRVTIVATPEDPTVRMAVAFGIGPGLPLAPGRHGWKVSDSAGAELARVGFDVRSPEAGMLH